MVGVVGKTGYWRAKLLRKELVPRGLARVALGWELRPVRLAARFFGGPCPKPARLLPVASRPLPKNQRARRSSKCLLLT